MSFEFGAWSFLQEQGHSVQMVLIRIDTQLQMPVPITLITHNRKHIFTYPLSFTFLLQHEFSLLKTFAPSLLSTTFCP